MGKKKKVKGTGKLLPEQIVFIESRVKELGNIERVSNFYNSDSLVCQYAKTFAEQYYNRPKVKIRKPLF